MKGTATLICGGLRVLIEWPDGSSIEMPMPRLDEPVANQLCSVCGMPFHMKRGLKRGEGVYCQDESCQRERMKINMRRRRAKSREVTA